MPTNHNQCRHHDSLSYRNAGSTNEAVYHSEQDTLDYCDCNVKVLVIRLFLVGIVRQDGTLGIGLLDGPFI